MYVIHNNFIALKVGENIKRVIIFIFFFVAIMAYKNIEVKAYTKYWSVTNSTNNFEDKIWYDDGEYSGYLYKDGSSYVSSGHPAGTKHVYGTKLWDRHVWEYERYLGLGESLEDGYKGPGNWTWANSYTWEWRGSDGDKLSEPYADDEGYTGVLTEFYLYYIDYDTQIWYYPYENGPAWPYNKLTDAYNRIDKTYLQGDVSRPDTRKYTQEYTGELTSNKPINDTFGIEGSPYNDNRGYWVKQGSPFTIWARAYSNSRIDAYRPNRIYYYLHDYKNNESGEIETNSSNEMKYKVKSGGIENNASLLGVSFADEINATAYSRLKTILNKDGMQTYYSFTSSKDYNGYVEADYSKDMFIVNSDGELPTGTFDPESVDVAVSPVIVRFTPYDGESGVKSWKYRISTVVNGNDNWDDWVQVNDGNWRDIKLSSVGNFKIVCDIADNVGNVGHAESGTYNIINPEPINGNLKMQKYDFQEYDDLNGNGIKDSKEPLKPIYWVKPHSEFQIYTDGYFPSSYNVYPTRTYVLYAKDNDYDINTSPRQYGDEYGSQALYNYEKYFNFTDGESAEFAQLDEKNYIKHTHKAECLNHGDKFKLYYTNSFMFDNKEYFNDYVDSGNWLKVDGKAPEGNGLIDLDDKTLDMTITASSVTDPDSGVGADSVWAMIYPLEGDNDITPDINDFNGNTEYKNSDKMKKKLIRQSNGLYKLTLNAYDDAFQSEKVKVVIGAIDNVGNIGILKDETVDLFTLKARIVPKNNMDYNSDTPPTLKRGQAGVLIMEVTGGAESLDIEYQELDALDNTLDKTITINPVENYKIENDNFIVPLYCDEKKYKVKVVAHRGNSTREAYPEMIVSDSILNGIRTRVR